MGLVSKPKKVKLVIGLLSNNSALLHKSIKRLEKIFGKIDFESEEIDFTYTNYYSEEMGEDLKRKFISFEKLRDLENICKVKVVTNKIEMRFVVSGKRMVNIDPGYLDLAKLVLFSTKDYSHRLYLGSGIFAEVTLSYKDKRFNFWPWTYPDYKNDAYLNYFDSVRKKYKDQVIK